jgi:hypothetical protein
VTQPTMNTINETLDRCVLFALLLLGPSLSSEKQA